MLFGRKRERDSGGPESRSDEEARSAAVDSDDLRLTLVIASRNYATGEDADFFAAALESLTHSTVGGGLQGGVVGRDTLTLPAHPMERMMGGDGADRVMEVVVVTGLRPDVTKGELVDVIGPGKTVSARLMHGNVVVHEDTFNTSEVFMQARGLDD